MSNMGDGVDLSILDGADVVSRAYGAGETIFVAEDDGDCMYIVRSGTVEIRYYGAVLDRIGRGGIFGEIAIIDGSTRSATAVAVADCELAEMTREGFLKLVQRKPTFALDVMKALAQRIRGMNESM